MGNHTAPMGCMTMCDNNATNLIYNDFYKAADIEISQYRNMEGDTCITENGKKYNIHNVARLLDAAHTNRFGRHCNVHVECQFEILKNKDFSDTIDQLKKWMAYAITAGAKTNKADINLRAMFRTAYNTYIIATNI